MRVVIFQHRLLHYRLEFFEALRNKLHSFGVELDLVHGQASATELKRKDTGTLPWATVVANRFMNVKGRDLLFQSIPQSVMGADLYVVMQENRILSNYRFLLARPKGCKVAFWGHGKNYQSTTPNGLREKWKRFLIHRVDWWFAYTESTVEHLIEQGYSPDSVTNLDNAIDTKAFKADLASVSIDEISKMRAELGISERAAVGLFCGSLYPEKKLDLLMQSADLIRAQCPDFHMIVIGDGPSANEVREFAQTRPWVHCTGVKKGHDKSILFRMSKVLLNPGAVGLHVLDSFTAGLPMVTTRNSLHGPEIAYLKSDINGVIVSTDDLGEYAAAILKLLTDPHYFDRLSTQCLLDADRYTVENMASNFCDGILRCLQIKPHIKVVDSL